MAAAKANEILDTIAVPVPHGDKEMLKKIAMTAMTGKSAGGSRGKALRRSPWRRCLAVEENGEVDVDNIKVEKKIGASAQDSEIIKGIVLDKKSLHASMPRKSRTRKSYC